MIANAGHRFVVLCAALASVMACQLADDGGGAVRHVALAGLEDVVSLDVTAGGDRVHALLATRAQAPGVPSIGYAFSRDQGETWSPPVALSRSDDPPVIAGHGNDVQLAVHEQNLVAVWQVAGTVPGTGPMRIAFSRDRGLTWQRGANPAVGDLTNNQSFMDLTADDAGQFHLVWLDDRDENGNSQGLRYARSADQGETWTPETTLDHSACTCCWNRLATLPGRGLAVLYRDQEPHDMRLSHSADGGRSWQAMPPVGDFGWHFSGCPHCGGALAVVARGDRSLLHSLVWTGKPEAAGLYFLSSSDQGKSWSPPQAIGSTRSRRADLAATDEQVAAVYTDAAAQTGALSFIRSEDAGRTWSPPKVLTRQADSSGQPRILATSGGFQAFWTEKNADGHDVLATAPLN